MTASMLSKELAGLVSSAGLPKGYHTLHDLQRGGYTLAFEAGVPRTGSFTCRPCQAGHECKLGDETEDICPAGTASNDNRTMCVPCAAGEFSDTPGAASCQKCPAGKYSDGEGPLPPTLIQRTIPEADCCADYYASGQTTSGVYTLGTGVEVYCDMDTAGGGWTVIQRRQDGSVPFNKNWEEYKQGFGDKNGEYWLGNENIHLLTTQNNYTLRIDMMAWDSQTRFAEYSTFRLVPLLLVRILGRRHYCTS
ncbi:ANGPT1 [Branchiostoma lanceolatum]|uniref:ANGPT1 protein n=1 Tax=Branchiostoma lanceolatum TaxID=7740 RepID=A0A8J9VWM9_BRALA|nr:ANGPT1 [Branchiostoma lanceolatum]